LEIGGNKITLNYTPDGKAKNEPKVGGGETKAPNKAAAKEEKKAAAPGEVVVLSKKEQNKLDKKNAKAAGKDGVKTGDAPPPSKGKKPEKPAEADQTEQIDSSAGGAAVSTAPTAPKNVLEIFDPIEKTLTK